MQLSDHRLRGKKMLVTGASGFLGSHLCSRLGTEGAEVIAVSRSLRAADASYLWRQGDMADVATVHDLLHSEKPDVIFHLSGHVTALPDRELVLPTLHSLLVSTVNVLTVATEIGCRRIVLAASLTEPGRNDSDGTPSSPYAAAKWACSEYGRMFHKLYGTPVVAVRPFMTYGPRQDPRKVIPYVTNSLLRGEAPKLSSGQWEADWIYIDDVVEGFLAAAERPDVEGCEIDLGTGILVPVRSVVHHLIELTGSSIAPLFGALPERPFEKVRTANTSHAYEKLGWKPTFSLEEGLRRTVAWCSHQAGVPAATVGRTKS